MYTINLIHSIWICLAPLVALYKVTEAMVDMPQPLFADNYGFYEGKKSTRCWKIAAATKGSK